ncbi:MAG: group III truncated hemoglobin [Nibricoccus sp.]
MPDSTSTATLFVRIGGRVPLLNLLRHFYADVRQHAEIGPIFAKHITDWPTHIEKIADFWTAAIGGPVLYRGPMPAKHVTLGLEERHFAAWLELWRRNCSIYLQPLEAQQMIDYAESIGSRLRHIISSAASGPASEPKGSTSPIEFRRNHSEG